LVSSFSYVSTKVPKPHELIIINMYRDKLVQLAKAARPQSLEALQRVRLFNWRRKKPTFTLLQQESTQTLRSSRTALCRETQSSLIAITWRYPRTKSTSVPTSARS